MPRSICRFLLSRDSGKRFNGVQALDDVSFEISAGEIVALLGENGVGESTLIKILAGVHVPSSGTLLFRCAPTDARAMRGRIAFVHRDLGLVGWMTVAEDNALATTYARWRGLIAWGSVRSHADAALSLVGSNIDPDQSQGRSIKSAVISRLVRGSRDSRQRLYAFGAG